MGFGQVEALQHEGVSLAYERQEGAAPTFVWLGGFKSDMAGTKAETLAAWARDRGQGFVRFDYSGHGRSGGQFEDGTISRWLGDALAVIDKLTAGPLALVGSSMGGWLALLAARARAERVAGLLLIAPATDFTERLMWDTFNAEGRRTIQVVGRLVEASQYSPEPNVLTMALIEDGRRHLLMDKPYPFDGPIHILQGAADPDVPEAHVRALAALLPAERVTFELIPDGDHRLSRPQDLARLLAAAERLAR
ncbi:alpha/beta fold hydrolase [Terricaulis silvestris]|uniref:Acetoin dehydrogenase E2 subunit dihydrolipoyllysine-residue acetyltransferase n=1 Tax=Terricaulis silvestris TaxID=2686094 RepID=A0A6I6MGS7_9CAUL|nr:alpha/beta hydrolase [Terricaulis silvestris]QGZ93945.1 acetoin dehydrogenase E2 subunit dihydrolipoyllysine-residue acetyltransferase [Terricaulis silvestris]